MTELSFAGYRSFAAGPDDPMRIKWGTVKSALKLDGVTAKDLSQKSPAALNLAVNRLIKYQAEPEGQDVWQRPSDTLQLGHGDCEDYAILKYALLAEAGVPVRLVVGQIKSIEALDGHIPHAWCAAYLANEWHALDQKFDHLIPVSEYINWLPIAACHDDIVMLFGRVFTMNEILAQNKV
jgi:hypothetical protein